jgi:PAS domain S-box-containing protein
MENEKKTKKQLIEELKELSQCVAELKGFEEEIKQTRVNQEKFTKAFLHNSIPAGIITLQEGRFVDVSNAFLRLMGRRRDEVVGHTPTEIGFIIEEQRVIFFNELTKRGRIENLETEVRAKDGALRHGLFNAVMMNINNEKYLLIVMTDITERKRAEEALRKNEEKYRLIAENMADVISVLDMKLRYTYISPSVKRLRGFTVEEAMKETLDQVFTPESIKIALAAFEEEMKLEASGTADPDRTRTIELEEYRKDGSSIWVEASSSYLRDKDNKPVGVLAVTRDITERKRAEEALRQSESTLHSVFLAAPVGICIMKNRLYQSANVFWCDTFGYPEEIIVGKDTRMLYENDGEYDRVGQELYSHLRERGLASAETMLRRRDGVFRDVILTAALLRADDLTAGTVVIIQDVTERKRAEKALRESEAKFRALTESSAAAIFLIQGTKYIYINPSFEKITGYTMEDLTNMNFWDFIHPDFRELVRNRGLSRIEGESPPSSYEIKFITKKGQEKWVDFSATVIELDNKPTIMGSTFDITKRKRAEEEKRILEERLQHADKMEAIGTLAGGIAHDFNNLLMGIQGHASLTLLDLDPSHPHYERLKRIEEQVQSGADLTKQLLGFARGGRYEVKPADMNDIIDRTSSMFGRTKKEISIHRKYGKDLWTVEVDQGQMEQVLMNLYVNAWQAMPGGGEIYLETENVLLEDEQAFPYAIKPGQYIKISVTDTGTGMDEKTKERIFDPFFTTKEMGRGTGLGLATVYGIIKGHKGMINVYSEPGHGTTFTIYLPASEKDAVEEKTSAGTIARGTETILLVDDEKMVVDVTRELLESLGYLVYAAGSGQEAIAVYMEKRKEIDLVILDMIMPGMSGGETFDRLREIDPEIRVLLSSGYSLNGEAQTIINRGCNGFLQKPFQLEILSQKVREMLD